MVRLEPDGKHRPLLNNFSQTPFPKNFADLKIGCKCKSLHNGHDSMPSSNNFNLKVSLVAVPADGSIIIFVNQKLEK